ncbi:MAG: OmcA/MtrC family decaheme c-type cytochrome [Halioglobus sp.]|nr:OmcA/MtrC family decaheme c-type cytochrome [Halioglobus sp.]
MLTITRTWLLAGLLGLLVACGGGGGGNSAPGVAPGPEQPNQPVPPDPFPPVPSTNPYAQAQVLNAAILNATINADNQPVIEFQLSDGNNVAITDLTDSDVRFVINKLENSPLGSMTGTWQSYINIIAEPEAGTGTEPELQATAERGSAGEFQNLGGGKYSYRFGISLTDLPQDILDQAATQGLDLSYDPSLTHRVAIQFDGAPGKANPYYDWVPATGATSGIHQMNIVATENCNRCHDPLAFHGGGRIDTEYCVTCHNAGTVDPDSTNTLDFKVMIHKIHRGANLPSVEMGTPYVIYGRNNEPHDYSHVHFPQDIRNCVNCHVGSATGADLDYELTETSQGDNWSIYATQAACGSCHDAVDFSRHAGGQTDDSNCDSCHSTGGIAGSIQDSHRILTTEASADFMAEILAVDNTAQGEMPTVNFRISNPQTGDDYDILTDPVFSGASINVRTAWNTTDFTNTGNGEDNANSVAASALSTAVPNGDGSFRVTMPVAIPDGSARPFIPANGSGAAVVEGRLSLVLETGASPTSVPLTNVHSFFSIDEPDGTAVPRRTSVELDNCLACHQVLSLHGSNRTDDIDSCVTCHNPRNTDRGVRGIASTPPTDGKTEESLDFKTMIHGIHAAGMRENPLQVVGFRGFTTYIYDEEHVQYPGNLANCVACHTDDGYTLPLPNGVLATAIDTGIDLQSPVDDTVVTPVTAVCSSCHDDAEAASHMTLQGGSFSTTQEAIDDGTVVETCSVCHGAGRDADVTEVHDIP